jgi:uncharacterized membrane protein YvlD (DUF360 family)
VTSPFRLAVRALVTWMIEAAGLYLMLRYLPGVTVSNWEVAGLSALVIGLLNALVRPAILMLVANLGAILFLIVALLLNGVLVWVAALIVPGFAVDGVLTAFLVAIGLAGINTVFTTLLSINDDDSFYRNVIRHLARRMVAEGELDRPGTVIVQIDGLSEPILRRGLREGRMPTLAALLQTGSHRLIGWESEVPSMTTSAQAGILHGTHGDVPAFYWYEKEQRRLRSSADPRDLHIVQKAISNGRGLLRDDGVSVSNLFSGDAVRTIMTVGTLLDDEGRLRADPHDYFGYLLNPYNLYRGIVGMLGEAVVESFQAIRQWLLDEQPRIRRLGLFTIHRGAANVILRDATTWSVIASMYQGHRIIYCDYQGYDEVGHFAGPETRDAVGTLNSIDRQIRQIALAAGEAPRRYRLVFLSDHGQTTSPVFEAVYGKPLDEIVREVINAGPTVRVSTGMAESNRYVGAFLNELARTRGLRGRGARRVLSTRRGSAMIEPVPEQIRRAADHDASIVMTSSGSLAHIYFAQEPGSLCFEQIEARYPGLIEALVVHDGVGLVLLRCEGRPPIVLGKQGARELDPDGIVEGDDPLAPYGEHAPTFFRQLAEYEHAGDIVVNGAYDPEKRWVVGFDDLVGAHGGVGGPQTQPFLIYPAEWTDDPPKLVGSVAVHHFLREHTSKEPLPPITPTLGPLKSCLPWAAARREHRLRRRPWIPHGPTASLPSAGEGRAPGERVPSRAEQPAATGDGP